MHSQLRPERVDGLYDLDSLQSGKPACAVQLMIIPSLIEGMIARHREQWSPTFEAMEHGPHSEVGNHE